MWRDVLKIKALVKSQVSENVMIATQLLKGNKELALAYGQELEIKTEIHQHICRKSPEYVDFVFAVCKPSKDLQYFLQKRYLPFVKFLGGKTVNALRSSGKKLNGLSKHWKLDLDISHWKIYESFEEFLRAYKIRELKMFRKPSRTLPDFVFEFPTLRTLWVGKCQLKELPDKWQRLPELNQLILSNNTLTSLPPSIASLRNLKNLGLENNRLETIPDFIREMTWLEHFNIGSKYLKELPDWLQHFKNLTYLGISKGQMEELPHWIGGFPKLKGLSIFRLSLERLPTSMRELKNLETLTLPNSLQKKFKVPFLLKGKEVMKGIEKILDLQGD